MVALWCSYSLMLLYSMGGAIALRSANQISSLLGVAVIDVVEGMH